ncbi:hypothetical protein A5658_08175 [Mycobacterium sp. 1245111.1]|uniref:alpha/beta hydrolase n=1 Tax=Mycobacterium sp. 1245111.1 TaxID=1834073 RepID=UPI0008018AAA|nr:hypothetical protein A5658_08175 [Mycobacterium sp. 1245111.1]
MRGSDAVRVERVTFSSSGEVLVGDLYLPSLDVDQRRPAVVVAGAWATVKEQMAGGYARQMAARGHPALAFDFRTWGQSGGQPRSMEDPYAKSADIVAAAEFLARYIAADQEAIAGLGICAGSSYMVAAATTAPLIQSVALVAPALPTSADVRENLGGTQSMATLIGAANEALAEYRRTGQQVLVPAVQLPAGDPVSAGDYYADRRRGGVPQWDNTFNPASWSSWIPFDVHSFADKLTQPLLIVHSDAAVNPGSVREFASKVPGPVAQLWLDGISQFDFYDQPGPMKAASDAAAAHFSRKQSP